jgi:hypothetical protein
MAILCLQNSPKLAKKENKWLPGYLTTLIGLEGRIVPNLRPDSPSVGECNLFKEFFGKPLIQKHSHETWFTYCIFYIPSLSHLVSTEDASSTLQPLVPMNQWR